MRAGTSKHIVLSALIAPEPTTSAVISERTEIAQSTVSAILSDARKQGLCTSDEGASVGRTFLWSLTENGRNVLGVDADGNATRVPPSKAELEAVRASPPGWNDQRTAMAERLYARLGWTAAETARAVGGDMTRSAVIGKAHREGWSMNRTASAPGAAYVRPSAPRSVGAARTPPKPKTKVEKPELRLVKPEPAPLAPEPEMPPVMHDDTAGAVLALGSFMCRWPLGDPSKAGFRFCCRRTAATYCGDHAKLAYVGKVKHEKPNDYIRSLRRWCA